MSNFKLSTPEELNNMLKDEKYIREYANYVIFEGMSRPKAWSTVFKVDMPMSDTHKTKMYRWLKKEEVSKWLERADKSLQVDWIDKRVNALQHLYDIGTNREESGKTQIDALDRFLTHLNKEENKIKLDIGSTTQVNIVQIVQEKLATITSGATINPDGLKAPKNMTNADLAIDAIIMKDR